MNGFGKSLALSALIALGGACGDEDEEGGEATGAECPEDSTLSYDTFGQNFFASYCNACHGAASPDRRGAPGSYTFDSVEEIRRHADEIDEWSAAGPNAVNTAMPPAGYAAQPSEEARRDLGEWLACGAP